MKFSSVAFLTLFVFILSACSLFDDKDEYVNNYAPPSSPVEAAESCLEGSTPLLPLPTFPPLPTEDN